MTIHLQDDIKIIEIISDRSIDSFWFDALEKIGLGTDKLKNNYKEIDLSMFISFYVAIKQEQILGFSGLQYMPDRWGKSIARCMSRFYLHPDARHGASLFQSPLLTEKILPMQINDATLFDLDTIFISRERGRLSFEKGIRYLRSKNPMINFMMLNDRYNVCGPMESVPESCKQHVAVMHLNDRGQDTWNLDLSKHRIV